MPDAAERKQNEKYVGSTADLETLRIKRTTDLGRFNPVTLSLIFIKWEFYGTIQG